ncbi:YbaB/EbfC family nucleoid-associated protein [Gordonia sp. zg691]|uniref:YbaB/EbfC family nucleoid-associated protein n=1 Tax=Gordonia jinghuaiqii TaxID=2758710 RepID=A0A7D7R5A8_9ACTN|nr:YbaB/EbfC family nucleoid-associated protein [Gordonia jinghuaiqii]MBD0861240.1 YbaB/EbfC family nucleoid-associated protein [Gordonia jinghuaiqii]MCR5980431.1 YbaB/EbfC family DNA-binding protein [Gordonia jinghuaiqii]QMT03392.1 YbaB/EbfC family nucleoid-associated protein [Gordonia jinghuaiqii]
MQGYSSMVDELDRQRADLARVRKALSELTSRATSRDRLVAVTVNARGLAVDITIEPAALRRYRADQLSGLLTTLIAEADAALRTRRDELLDAAMDSDIDYADARIPAEPRPQ